ncbi:MAG: cytochrome c-type biogenesis protein [Microgenomates group bacterium]
MRWIICALMLFAAPAFAVLPDEIMADPALEARARAISQDLRCPVCQGENIDDSSAPISRDLRLAVRERLLAGDSDDQVFDYVVARFGEFVLFKPRAQGSTLLLWLAGPLMLLGGAAIAVLASRRRATVQTEADSLSDADKVRLADLLKK